jgi:hypothetical protein
MSLFDDLANDPPPRIVVERVITNARCLLGIEPCAYHKQRMHMNHGYILITKDLVDRGTPDFHRALDEFMNKGKHLSITTYSQHLLKYELDHLDFDVPDVRYDLSFERFRDEEKAFNPDVRLRRLERFDEKEKKFVTVKEYV